MQGLTSEIMRTLCKSVIYVDYIYLMNKNLYCFFFTFLFLSGFTKASADTEKSFSFALVGDLPYGVKIGEISEEFNKLTTQINDDASLSWVLHAGDIKTGASKCSNEFLIDRKKRFDKLNPPFIYTPGDNEWTDCHRITAGNYDPLERLDYLRDLFFDSSNKQFEAVTDSFVRQNSLGAPFDAFVENAMWKKSNVVFSTIHVVGSFNGTAGFSLLSSFRRTKKYDEEVKARTEAALYWLEATFELAAKDNAHAVFITIHANPGLLEGASRKDRRAFMPFLKQLHKLAKAFGKPVILTHGDTHTFKIDQQALIGDDAPKHFLRVETFGEANGNWIKVTVDPRSPGVFSFMPVTN